MLTLLPFLSLVPSLPLAHTPSPPPPVEQVQPQRVRPLPGHLDAVPVFNSNSPELVQTEGILLSTFPPEGMAFPSAHLNFPFEGRFDVFAHHIAKAKTPDDLRTLYLGILLHNPTAQPVTIDVLQAASYLSQPDAPFIPLPPVVENPLGNVYAGPGSRITNDVLRGMRQAIFPAQLTLPPRSSQMLLNVPIPVKTLDPPLNGRSTLVRLRSRGRVYAASLAQFAPKTPEGEERSPTLEEWETLLKTHDIAGARDHGVATPVEQLDKIIYGRVSGVAQGSQWQATVTDSPTTAYLTIPEPGQAFSYGISTLHGGRMGSGQTQSAPMLVRYPGTAYQAYGNYGIQYNLYLPLSNPSDRPHTVTLALQTPLKEETLTKNGLRFLDPPEKRVFFRGTVRVYYDDDRGLRQTRYVHLVEQRGQQGEPLVTLTLPPHGQRFAEFSLVYPPDSTPPQIFTIRTLE